MNDIESRLIKKCKKGNINAFEELIKKYERTSYNIALKMLKNPDDAMDISQESLIKVFRSIKNFKFQSSFSTWLYKIVVNTCLDHLRKRQVKVYSIDNPIQMEDGEIQRDIMNDLQVPEIVIEKKMTREIVRKAVDRLNNDHRTIIILRDIQEFSYQEISDILDCSIGTVKSRINRARSKLKDILLRDMEQNDEINV